MTALAVLTALCVWIDGSRVVLFWMALILTRPLGATVGDFPDNPVSQGGHDWSRPLASAVLTIFIVACLFVIRQRAGRHPGERRSMGSI